MAGRRLIVIGAGPIGLAAALGAVRRGLDVEVLERDARDHRDLRPHDRPQQRVLPRRAHAQLQHRRVRLVGPVEQRQRHPEVVVEVARGRNQPRIPGPQHRVDHRPRRRLAVAPGHRHHRPRHPVPGRPRQRVQARQRVRHLDHRAARVRRRPPGLAQQRRRPARQRRRDEVVPVAGGHDRHEQAARHRAPAVDEHAGDRSPIRGAAPHQATACGRRQCLGGPVHAPGYQTLAPPRQSPPPPPSSNPTAGRAREPTAPCARACQPPPTPC